MGLNEFIVVLVIALIVLLIKLGDYHREINYYKEVEKLQNKTLELYRKTEKSDEESKEAKIESTRVLKQIIKDKDAHISRLNQMLLSCKDATR